MTTNGNQHLSRIRHSAMHFPCIIHKAGIIIIIILISEMGKLRHQEKFNLSDSVAVR